MLNVISLGDDDDVVPVVELEEFFEARLIDDVGGDESLAVGLPGGVLAHQADATALAALVVNKAGNAGQLRFIAKLMLVAANDPFVLYFVIGDVSRAVLDARVVGGVAAEGEAEIEVGELAALPDEEGVAHGGVFGRRFAVDNAIL